MSCFLLPGQSMFFVCLPTCYPATVAFFQHIGFRAHKLWDRYTEQVVLEFPPRIPGFSYVHFLGGNQQFQPTWALICHCASRGIGWWKSAAEIAEILNPEVLQPSIGHVGDGFNMILWLSLVTSILGNDLPFRILHVSIGWFGDVWRLEFRYYNIEFDLI